MSRVALLGATLPRAKSIDSQSSRQRFRRRAGTTTGIAEAYRGVVQIAWPRGGEHAVTPSNQNAKGAKPVGWLRMSVATVIMPGLVVLLIPFGTGCGHPAESSRPSYRSELSAEYNPQDAYDLVKYLSQRWRLRGGGNKGYNDSIDHVRDFLVQEGFERVGKVEVLEGPLTLEPLLSHAVSNGVDPASPAMADCTK